MARRVKRGAGSRWRVWFGRLDLNLGSLGSLRTFPAGKGQEPRGCPGAPQTQHTTEVAGDGFSVGNAPSAILSNLLVLGLGVAVNKASTALSRGMGMLLDIPPGFLRCGWVRVVGVVVGSCGGGSTGGGSLMFVVVVTVTMMVSYGSGSDSGGDSVDV